MWGVFETKIDGLHIIPIDDLQHHAQDEHCWCEPEQDTEEPEIYIHNSLDEREKYEDGRLLIQ